MLFLCTECPEGVLRGWAPFQLRIIANWQLDRRAFSEAFWSCSLGDINRSLRLRLIVMKQGPPVVWETRPHVECSRQPVHMDTLSALTPTNEVQRPHWTTESHPRTCLHHRLCTFNPHVTNWVLTSVQGLHISLHMWDHTIVHQVTVSRSPSIHKFDDLDGVELRHLELRLQDLLRHRFQELAVHLAGLEVFDNVLADVQQRHRLGDLVAVQHGDVVGNVPEACDGRFWFRRDVLGFRRSGGNSRPGWDLGRMRPLFEMEWKLSYILILATDNLLILLSIGIHLGLLFKALQLKESSANFQFIKTHNKNKWRATL